jgi:hypothetical protein
VSGFGRTERDRALGRTPPLRVWSATGLLVAARVLSADPAPVLRAE